jgi:ribonucleoside-diphosphate reductase alpha chain
MLCHKQKIQTLNIAPLAWELWVFKMHFTCKKIPYASEAAVDFADESMELVSYMAIAASSDLAKERGSYLFL